MKRIWNMIALLAVLHLALLAGGVALLFGSGRMNVDKFQRIVGIVREQEQDPTLAEVSPAEPTELPQASSERIAAEIIAEEIKERRVDRQLREVKDRQGMIDQAKEILQRQQEQLLADQQAFQQYVENYRRRLQREGFSEAVVIYSKMAPAAARDLLMKMEDFEAMEYLGLMNPRARTKIVKQFQSPAEMDKIGRVLSLLANEQKVSLQDLR